jgi:hypothetical protein
MDRFMRLVTFSLFAAAAAAQSSPPSWNLFHPDATALIGIDVRNLREWAAAQPFGGGLDQGGPGMFHFPGMEALKEIDQVFLSSPGTNPAKRKENPPFLAVVTGHFQADHVQQFLHGSHQTYRTVDVYSLGGGSNVTNVAALDQKTLILGDDASVRGAIDRRNQRTTGSNALLERATALAAANDFWLITSVSPSDFQPANVNFGQMFADIKGVDTGFSVHDGFNFEVSLSAKSPEAAQALAQQLLQQLEEATAGKLDDQQAAELFRSLRIDGDRLHMKVALSKDELDRQIRAMQAARPFAAAPRPTAPGPKVEDSGPKTIRIFGLDEGVREIPLTPNKN